LDAYATIRCVILCLDCFGSRDCSCPIIFVRADNKVIKVASLAVPKNNKTNISTLTRLATKMGNYIWTACEMCNYCGNGIAYNCCYRLVLKPTYKNTGGQSSLPSLQPLLPTLKTLMLHFTNLKTECIAFQCRLKWTSVFS